MNIDQLKFLAKQAWISGDHEGNDSDYYYFEHGFISGARIETHLSLQRLEALEELSRLDQEMGLE